MLPIWHLPWLRPGQCRSTGRDVDLWSSREGELAQTSQAHLSCRLRPLKSFEDS